MLTTPYNHELEQRAPRRIQHHLTEALLPRGKTRDSFVFAEVPNVAQAKARASAEDHGSLKNGVNPLPFYLPSVGKVPLGPATAHKLAHRGYKILRVQDSDPIPPFEEALLEPAISHELSMLQFPHVILDTIAVVGKKPRRIQRAIHARRRSQRVQVNHNNRNPAASPMERLIPETYDHGRRNRQADASPPALRDEHQETGPPPCAGYNLPKPQPNITQTQRNCLLTERLKLIPSRPSPPGSPGNVESSLGRLAAQKK